MGAFKESARVRAYGDDSSSIKAETVSETVVHWAAHVPHY